MKTKPKTIVIPENVLSMGEAVAYRHLVHEAVAQGYAVEHAELHAWLRVMHRRGRLDLVPDCPYASARVST